MDAATVVEHAFPQQAAAAAAEGRLIVAALAVQVDWHRLGALLGDQMRLAASVAVAAGGNDRLDIHAELALCDAAVVALAAVDTAEVAAAGIAVVQVAETTLHRGSALQSKTDLQRTTQQELGEEAKVPPG
jgi:hypothetical protein